MIARVFGERLRPLLVDAARQRVPYTLHVSLNAQHGEQLRWVRIGERSPRSATDRLTDNWAA